MTQSIHSIKSMIGVDVAKHKLDIHILSTGEDQIVENSNKGVKAFIKQLKAYKGDVMIVMENTGGYEKLAHRLLTEAGFGVHVAHATRAYYFARQKGYFAKTDRLDARMLAEYGEQELVSATPLPTEIDEELKGLVSRRNQVIEQLTTEQLRCQRPQSAVVKASLQRQVKQLTKERKLLEMEIRKRIESDEEKRAKSKRLQTFKGVGETIANNLVSALPELGQLSREQIACLVGVAPKNCDSGKKRGRRMISGGRFAVRRQLYMAALVSIRHNPRFSAYYAGLKSRDKHSKVALVAVMRKIIITLNAMLRDEKDWEGDYAHCC